MWDLLQWLQAVSDLSAPTATNLNASNIVFIAYVLGYLIGRKGALISVFLFVELVGITPLLDGLSNILYYLFHASIYIILYWWLNKDKLIKNKQLLTCFLVALLSIGMALDAYFYAKIETLFYSNYEYLFVVVHILFVCSFIDLKRIVINARSIFSKRFRMLANSHSGALNHKINERR